MFYSQSLISKKGPLRIIWLAAYCHQKLKKEQIAQTNIASSVDKIIPDAYISYRILAQLLLGIVRIFSKKVDFLHHECNEALLRIQKAFILIPRHASERTTTAPCYKEAIGKPVHGRGKVPVSADSKAKKAPETYPEKAMISSYNNVSLIIPDSFRLDTFDLEIEDQGDDVNNNQYLTLECDEEGDWQYTSKEHRYPIIEVTNAHDACFTPFEDSVLNEILDVSFKNNELDNTSTPAPRGENFPSDLAKSRSKTLPTVRRSLTVDIQSNEVDELQHIANMEVQQSECPDTEAAFRKGQEKPETSEKNQDKFATQLAIEDESRDHVDMMEAQRSEYLAPEETAPIEGIEKPMTPDRIGGNSNAHLAADEVHRLATIEVQQSELPESGTAPVEGQEKPKTPDRTHDNSSVQLTAASPEFTVKTPVKKEGQKFSRKRKCVFDEDIVLSNEILRRGIHDARDLVLKRRKAPHTLLDFWKAEKFSNIKKVFAEPLISYKTLEIKDLKLKKARESKRIKESMLQEQIEVQDVSMEHQVPDISMHEAPVDITSGGFVDNLDSSKLTDDTNKELPAQEMEDLAWNFENQECSSTEEGTSYKDGLSSRTRTVRKFYYKSFVNQKERGLSKELSLTGILEGKKRAACARFFYETLVLKTSNFIDVKQAAPYADVLLFATPKLTESCCADC